MIVRLLILMLAVLTGAILYVYFLDPAAAPWVPSGRIVIIAYAVPEPHRATSTVMGIGIDDITLLGANEETRASLLTRRVLLDSSSIVQKRLLEATVPVGHYEGVSFILKSPELRNDWQEDAPPERVRLAGDVVTIDSSFSVLENTTSVLVLGFETLAALHSADTGFQYLPVIHLEARTGATLVDLGEDIVRIEGGIIDASQTWGMDRDGMMRLNFRERRATVPLPPAPEDTTAAETTAQEPDMAPGESSPATSTATTSDLTTATSTAPEQP